MDYIRSDDTKRDPFRAGISSKSLNCLGRLKKNKEFSMALG
jgi:hypothetical protein